MRHGKMKGIYIYIDLETDDIVYVGKDSHIHRNLRHKAHLNPKRYDNQQINRVLQNNPERYEYSVLYSSDDVSEDDLNMLEISFIERYNPRFNFTKGGDGSTGYKHSEEAKQKISKNHADVSGENNPFYGKKHTEENKKKISESLTGKFHSEEEKIKISKAQNTVGYYRVSKVKRKTYKQGFSFRYRYYEDGEYKSIESINLKKLEQKVKAKGLKWREL